MREPTTTTNRLGDEDALGESIQPKEAPALASSIASIVLAASLFLTACSQASTVDDGATATDGSGAETSVTIFYLANEGFLIEAEDKSVLIDALFGDGLGGYPAVPLPLRSELEGGEGRFAEVDCVLATHAHADHFSAREVAGFLERVPAQFLSTREAVEEVSGLLAGDAPPAPRWLRPARHSIETIDCGGIEVSAMSFHHGRLMVKNLAYLIELGGLTLLHVGDTEITAQEIRPWGLGERNIDVAMLPAWHLTERSWIPVIEEIGAREIIAMHLASPGAPSSWFGSAGSLDARVDEIRRHVPRAWIPMEPLAERTFTAAR